MFKAHWSSLVCEPTFLFNGCGALPRRRVLRTTGVSTFPRQQVKAERMFNYLTLEHAPSSLSVQRRAAVVVRD